MNGANLDMTDIEAVILDLDGVITQTARVHSRAWKQTFVKYLEDRKKRGEKPVEDYKENEDYLTYIDGKPRYEGVKSSLESRNIHLPYGDPADSPDKETICGLGNQKNRLFLELVKKDGVDVYDDTIDLVRHWRENGIKTAVVSSSKNCETILKSVGLNHLFDTRVDGKVSVELNLKGKPEPDIFTEAAKQLGVKPAQAIVVEDAISGVQAGRAGNFKHVIGIARHDQFEELRRHGADIVVRTLGDLKIKNPTSKEGSAQSQSMDLPSALEHQEEINRQLSNKNPAIFLDYDGTLTPIVNRPEDAVLSDDMRAILNQLAKLCTVAIVSGRDRADVKNLVNLDELIYAGSHGFDITGPGDMHLQYEGGKESLPALDQAETELHEKIDPIPGAQVERKKFSIAVHYRNAAEEKVPEIKKITDEVLHSTDKLKKGLGKKIIELKPDIQWDKGKAVFWLLEKLGLDKPDVLPFYIGDDITDEDAFRALFNRGISILVGHHGEPTYATFGLDDVEGTKQFLGRLVKHMEGDRR